VRIWKRVFRWSATHLLQFLQFIPDIASDFVHRNSCLYNEGGGKSKYCVIGNFCSRTLMGVRTAALCSHNFAVEWVEILQHIWGQDVVAGFNGLTHSIQIRDPTPPPTPQITHGLLSRPIMSFFSTVLGHILEPRPPHSRSFETIECL